MPTKSKKSKSSNKTSKTSNSYKKTSKSKKSASNKIAADAVVEQIETTPVVPTEQTETTSTLPPEQIISANESTSVISQPQEVPTTDTAANESTCACSVSKEGDSCCKEDESDKDVARVLLIAVGVIIVIAAIVILV